MFMAAVGAPVCFAGDTKVLVQDSSRRGFQAVAIRDVQTGQYVQCLNSTDDMRVPTTISWCLVQNWCGLSLCPCRRPFLIGEMQTLQAASPLCRQPFLVGERQALQAAMKPVAQPEAFSPTASHCINHIDQ